MHSAPSRLEKYAYVRQNKFHLYSFGILSTALLLAGGILFSTHDAHFLWYGAYVLFMAFYLGVSYFIGVFSRDFDIAGHHETFATSGDFRPSIDIYLPSAGEPLEVIKNTFTHVAFLRWPYDLIKIYVLDDSHREEVKKLAHDFGFSYFARPNKGELKKAGNIRYAFPQTSGEIIAIFDADFCPRPDFLKELIPHMANPKVAIVQSAQYFDVKKSMPWVERGSGAVQELFYRLIQVNRDEWGAAICVGTNALYRRKALEPYGGTYPIEHSEDVHTGFNLIKDGWELKYIPLNLAKGTCPDNINSYITQQYRWCMGSTSLCFNWPLFWKHKIGLMRRLCYLSGMTYYIATAIGIFMTPLPGLLMIYFKPEHVFWFNTMFSLPSFIFGVWYMGTWNKSKYGLSAVRARFLSYYAHVAALTDKLFGSVMEWVPTGDAQAAKKNKTPRKVKRLLLVWNTIILTLGINGFLMNLDGHRDYDFYPFLAFLLINSGLQLSCLHTPKVKANGSL